MSEIKRYYPSDIKLKSGDNQVVLTEHPSGQICMYEDVEPTIQRNKELESENKELEAEIKRLREQEPVAFGNLKPSVSDSDRVLFTDIDAAKKYHNDCYQLDALYLHAGAEPKPAQEMPSELIEWANSWQEDDSDMPSYLVGCNDMKHFVKSQLEK
jgi:hypothetical protein